MQKNQNLMMHRKIIDVCMTVLLLFLMAYQVTGEALHEWIGMGMNAARHHPSDFKQKVVCRDLQGTV